MHTIGAFLCQLALSWAHGSMLQTFHWCIWCVVQDQGACWGGETLPGSRGGAGEGLPVGAEGQGVCVWVFVGVAHMHQLHSLSVVIMHGYGCPVSLLVLGPEPW
jgi:hypothetical protein